MAERHRQESCDESLPTIVTRCPRTGWAVDHDLQDQKFCDPADQSLAREEFELIDRMLHALPSHYREPLVLFYREQQSVARVAELLDLSPDTIKQRLSRGRDLLRSEVEAILEQGLLSTSPGNSFTMGVLAALPVLSHRQRQPLSLSLARKGYRQ